MKNYVKYGLIMSSLIVLCLIYMEVSGNNLSFNKNPIFEVISLLAPVVVWYFGIASYKKILGGIMDWKEGAWEGFRISLVYGLVSPFIFMAYYLIFNMEILNFAREVYRMPNAGDAQIIMVDMGVQAVAAVVMGVLISMVISFFLKTKKNG